MTMEVFNTSETLVNYINVLYNVKSLLDIKKTLYSIDDLENKILLCSNNFIKEVFLLSKVLVTDINIKFSYDSQDVIEIKSISGKDILDNMCSAVLFLYRKNCDTLKELENIDLSNNLMISHMMLSQHNLLLKMIGDNHGMDT